MTNTITLLTNYGNEQVLTAIAEGTNVIVSAIAYGDANGESYVPNREQTSLVHQLGTLSDVSKSYDDVDDFIYFSATLPANTPECTIRELGLIDNYNKLLSVSVIPPTAKPALEEGLEVTMPIMIGFKTSTGEVMIVEVGPGTDIPDKDWVNQRINNAIGNIKVINSTNW